MLHEERCLEKVAEYISLLKREGVSDFTLTGSFIAGGAIRSLLTGEDVKDVDIFFRSMEAYDMMVKEINANSLFTLYTSENATTARIMGVEFQLIKCKVGNPVEIISEFDFKMNMNYVELGTPTFVYVEHPEIVATKQLSINPACRNKIGTLVRLIKFLERGYTLPSRMDITRIAVQLTQENPVTKFSQLEESSRCYFTAQEYSSVDFVEKDEASKFVSKYAGSGF